jgi:hypothetical protein
LKRNTQNQENNLENAGSLKGVFGSQSVIRCESPNFKERWDTKIFTGAMEFGFNGSSLLCLHWFRVLIIFSPQTKGLLSRWLEVERSEIRFLTDPSGSASSIERSKNKGTIYLESRMQRAESRKFQVVPLDVFFL